MSPFRWHEFGASTVKSYPLTEWHTRIADLATGNEEVLAKAMVAEGVHQSAELVSEPPRRRALIGVLGLVAADIACTLNPSRRLALANAILLEASRFGVSEELVRNVVRNASALERAISTVA